jgi:hypothetical protein
MFDISKIPDDEDITILSRTPNVVGKYDVALEIWKDGDIRAIALIFQLKDLPEELRNRDAIVRYVVENTAFEELDDAIVSYGTSGYLFVNFGFQVS